MLQRYKYSVKQTNVFKLFKIFLEKYKRNDRFVV